MSQVDVGSVVRVKFPWGSEEKYDPRFAVVIASYPYGGDYCYILAMMTRGGKSDSRIHLEDDDFAFGWGTYLPATNDCYCRPFRVWSCERNMMETIGACLTPAGLERIRGVLRKQLSP